MIEKGDIALFWTADIPEAIYKARHEHICPRCGCWWDCTDPTCQDEEEMICPECYYPEAGTWADYGED